MAGERFSPHLPAGSSGSPSAWPAPKNLAPRLGAGQTLEFLMGFAAPCPGFPLPFYWLMDPPFPKAGARGSLSWRKLFSVEMPHASRDCPAGLHPLWRTCPQAVSSRRSRGALWRRWSQLGSSSRRTHCVEAHQTRYVGEPAAALMSACQVLTGGRPP